MTDDCRLTTVDSRQRGFDGLENLLIAGAAAQIARQGFTNLIARRVRMLVEQRLGRDEQPRRAVPALRRAEVGEGVLQRMKASVGGEPFDRCDAPAVALEAEHEAREHGPIVEQDGARAALAELAAVLGPAQVQIFTKDLEQRLVRRERD